MATEMQSAKSAELRAAIKMAIERVQLMPVQRTVGAGYVVQNDMVIALPVDAWDRIVRALDAEEMD